jgi:RHS repeat-associated protein
LVLAAQKGLYGRNRYGVFDGWNLLAELDENGVAKATYVWGLDLSQSLQGAGGIGGLLARVDEVGVYTYTFDGNGNVGQLIGAISGNLIATYEYAPFGRAIVAIGPYTDVNPFCFSTKYFDFETELYYYGYRYYDAEVGRWVSRDPLGEEGGLNLYLFVYNESLNWVDPYGDSPFSVMAKFMVKKGIKEGLKEFAERQVKKRFQKYMKEKTKKEFAEELEGILSSLDSTWWEICIELSPVLGDFYGGGKLALKARDAYDQLQDLENKYVEKIYDSLPKSQREKFMASMRRAGVRDARVDTKTLDKVTGSATNIKGKQGHHMDNVKSTPGRASDPRNIDFQTPSEHLDSHEGNWRNDTSSNGVNIYRN